MPFDRRPVKLMYRSSRDGYKPADFHSKTDFIGRTLTVLRVVQEKQTEDAAGQDQIIIGAYADRPFDFSRFHLPGEGKSFLFKYSVATKKLTVAQCTRPGLEIDCNKDHLISFGGDGAIHHPVSAFRVHAWRRAESTIRPSTSFVFEDEGVKSEHLTDGKEFMFDEMETWLVA